VRYLRLLSALSNALNHQMRTPLSVIQNELTYLQSLVSPGECDRALNSCQKIQQILAKFSSYLKSDNSFHEINLEELLSEFQKIGLLVNAKKDVNDRKIFCNKELLSFAVHELHSAIQELQQVHCEIDCCTNKIILRWTLDVSLYHEITEPKVFNSFSEFFCLFMHRDIFELPVIDAIFLDHNCQMEVQVVGSRDGVIREKSRDRVTLSVKIAFA
jgi:hypothetical protein